MPWCSWQFLVSVSGVLPSQMRRAVLHSSLAVLLSIFSRTYILPYFHPSLPPGGGEDILFTQHLAIWPAVLTQHSAASADTRESVSGPPVKHSKKRHHSIQAQG
ncbi:hypothetical protein AAFF_G00123700 [Aldrovandia affinis]|uniref:Uncharacterized protein n=1 Tax=Aldrovandia affinis TaxID=143900 RepID=A0AAD7RRP7_9TELE|nr:hypothetical protein AAFF_G00123700 [Aldrovandia affinis]